MVLIAYSVLMFAIAALFLSLAVAIYGGNTNLIHDYHQTHIKETDKKDYGKSFSIGLFLLAVSLITSGIVALLGANTSVVIISISILFVGMMIAFTVMAKVQKKYNGGY